MGGPLQEAHVRQSVSKKKQTQISHNLFNAVTFQAASASLLLHLAGGAVAHPPAVGVAGGGRELHVLLVDPWGNTQIEVSLALPTLRLNALRTDASANKQVSM